MSLSRVFPQTVFIDLTRNRLGTNNLKWLKLRQTCRFLCTFYALWMTENLFLAVSTPKSFRESVETCIRCRRFFGRGDGEVDENFLSVGLVLDQNTTVGFQQKTLSEYTKTDCRMDSFYVIVASNSSQDLNPDNTLVNFKNNLPLELDVSEYRVALQSIYLDNRYGNIPTSILGTNTHFVLFLQDPRNSNPVATYTITDFSVQPKRFVLSVNKELTKLGTGRVVLAEIEKRIQVTLNRCFLLVHPELQKCLNFEKETLFSYCGQDYAMLSSGRGVNRFSSQNDFPVDEAKPRVIKVQLMEMNRHLSDINLVQDLAIIRVKPRHITPFYSVCERKEYFGLSSSKLAEISIRLVDENNWPLRLGHGQPTFVQLQFKRFPMISNVLRLSSLESSHFFSDNCNSSFRIILQQELDSRKWDVALSSIYLPSTTDIEAQITSNNFYIDLPDGKQLVLNELEDLTQQAFVKLVSSQLAAHYPSAAERPFQLSIEEDNVYAAFSHDAKLKISSMLSFIIGRVPSPDHANFLVLEGQKDRKVKLGKLDFDKLHPHKLLLYCNFVAPIIFGNKFGQVLKIIPYGKSVGDDDDGVIKYEASHLDFLPLLMNDRHILQFELRNSSGQVVKFKETTSEILLTLVFREKKIE